MREIFVVKIVTNSWLSKVPVTSGKNKSFGPVTIADFHAALVNVKQGKPTTDLEKWIASKGFFKTFPPELVVRFTVGSFVYVLHEYSKNIHEFLDQNAAFYLWLHPEK
jgi:hypothetical protein